MTLEELRQQLSESKPASLAERNRIAALAVVELFEQALRNDPVAMSSLMLRTHVRCNTAMANMSFVQVRTVPETADTSQPQHVVGPLGVLNGVLELLTGQRIAVEIDDASPYQVQRFFLWAEPVA